MYWAPIEVIIEVVKLTEVSLFFNNIQINQSWLTTCNMQL